MRMLYDDIKHMNKLERAVQNLASKMTVATTAEELDNLAKDARQAVTELAYFRKRFIDAPNEKQVFCDGCHFCWHDEGEDRYLCTARGGYVKPYQVRDCGLYMKEGVV